MESKAYRWFALFVISVIGSGCNEHKTLRYENYAALESQSIFEKGWIIKDIPNTANDIKIELDLDTNESFVDLQFDLNESWRSSENCQFNEEIKLDSLNSSQSKYAWIQKHSTSTESYKIYKCKNKTYLCGMAVGSDASSKTKYGGRLFFWCPME